MVIASHTSLRLFALASLIANAACNSGGGGTPDASTEGGAEAGGKDGGKDAGNIADSGNDAGQDSGGTTLNPECTAPVDAGSGGSCVTLTGDGGVECNPVTNGGCNADAGEACDRTQIGGTHCFSAPPNTAALCAVCDDTNGPACIPTATCVPTMNGVNCARFCCVDGDCGSGHCDTVTLGLPNFGVCVQ